MSEQPKVTDSKPRQSSLVRVATFIASVGEGERFTKQHLLAAVPNVSQADRRMRDLRPLGWVIDNYKVNPNLAPDEYLLRTIGIRVDRGEKAPPSRKTISGPKRRTIFERDGHRCQVCGTPAGSAFHDVPTRRATLTIGHIVPVARGGGDESDNLRAECQRCNDESRDVSMDPASASEVLTLASHVGGVKEKRILFGWMQAGRRAPDDKENVFNAWARLPYTQRLEVMAALGVQVMKIE